MRRGTARLAIAAALGALACAATLHTSAAQNLQPRPAPAQVAQGGPGQKPPGPAGQKPAGSDKLIVTLSRERILIQSQFSGENLALFGVIQDTAANKSAYDAVVTVRGPRGAVSVRRKMQSGPFWLNLDSRKYIAIPAYLAVLSNREIESIASSEVREDLRIGIQSQIPQQAAVRGANDPEFRAALQRIRESQELFAEDSTSVNFITPTVFQASIAIPGIAPLGRYDIDVAIFNDGALYARQTLNFRVEKSGTEQFITSLAHVFPVTFGILTALIALLFGWIASVIFRRD